jgi:predicted nucleotidyltransferase
MITRDRILELLRMNKGLMQEQFAVRRIGLFGSYVRNEPATDSDIDLLVEFDDPTYDHYMDLKFYLEDIFKAEVDLVMADGLKPRLKPHITHEIVYA